MSNFLEVVWLIVISFAFISYLFILFYVVSDLFRDAGLGGGGKAAWIVFLIFFPLLASIVYLLARGKGMSERSAAAAKAQKSAADEYIKSVAGVSPADQIASAKALLDAGTVTQAEYEALKAKALA